MASKEDSLQLPAPPGWIKKLTPKKSGTPNKNDIIFVSPTGEEIKGKRQLEQYLKAHPGGPAASEFDWTTGDTPRRSARLSEKFKAVEVPESESPKKKQKKSSTKNETKEKDNTDAEGKATNDEDVDAEGETTINKDAEVEGEDKDTAEEGKAATDKDADTKGDPAIVKAAEAGDVTTADMDVDSSEKASNDKDTAAQEETKENVEATILVSKDDGDKEVVSEGTLPQKPDAEDVINEAITEIVNAKPEECDDPKTFESKNVAETKDIKGEDNLKEKDGEEKPVENEPVFQEPTAGR